MPEWKVGTNNSKFPLGECNGNDLFIDTLKRIHGMI